MTDAPARLETGVLQDGDDWPGVFIRGDNALMGYAPALAAVLCGRATSLHENMVGRLLALLQRCGDREADKQVIRRAATPPAPVEALVEALRDCCDELEREGSRPAHRTRTAHRARAALAAYEGEQP